MEATTPVSTTFAGHEAFQLDVLAVTPPDEVEDEGPCWGGPILVGGFYREGILACTWTRIWVVDVEGVSVTVFGSAGYFDNDLDTGRVWQLEEILPHLEDFEDAVTFCTEVTPCDGPAPGEG